MSDRSSAVGHAVGVIGAVAGLVGAIAGIGGYLQAQETAEEQRATRVSILGASMPEQFWLGVPEEVPVPDPVPVTVTLSNDAIRGAVVERAELLVGGKVRSRRPRWVESPAAIEGPAGLAVAAQAAGSNPLPLNLPERQGQTRVLLFRVGPRDVPPALPPEWIAEARRGPLPKVELRLHVQGDETEGDVVRGRVAIVEPLTSAFRVDTPCGATASGAAVTVRQLRDLGPAQVATMRLWNLSNRSGPSTTTRPLVEEPELRVADRFGAVARAEFPLPARASGEHAYTISVGASVIDSRRFDLRDGVISGGARC